MAEKAGLAVLASGRGSNFRSILESIQKGELAAEIRILISDRSRANALEYARNNGIEAKYISYDKDNRELFEREAADIIEEKGCELVILAGFMRILTPYFISRFPNRILNIHPSLLPAFRGVAAQRQAIEAGVRVSGCTVHVVTETLDDGPILAQTAVPVLETDTEETLAARILVEEHRTYPQAIGDYLERISNGVASTHGRY